MQLFLADSNTSLTSGLMAHLCSAGEDPLDAGFISGTAIYRHGNRPQWWLSLCDGLLYRITGEPSPFPWSVSDDEALRLTLASGLWLLAQESALFIGGGTGTSTAPPSNEPIVLTILSSAWPATVAVCWCSC